MKVQISGEGRGVTPSANHVCKNNSPQTVTCTQKELYIQKVKKIIFGHFLAKNHSKKFFPKKLFESISSLYTAVTSCKKIIKSPCIDFS